MREGKPRPFSKRPVFRIALAEGTGQGDSRPKPKLPRIDCDDTTVLIAYRLARLGFFGGDPSKVLNAPADIVQMAIDYVTFEADYEAAYIDLNNPSGA